MFELSKQNFQNESRAKIREFLVGRLARIVFWFIVGAVVAVYVPEISGIAIGVSGLMIMVQLLFIVIILPFMTLNQHVDYRKLMAKK